MSSSNSEGSINTAEVRFEEAQSQWGIDHVYQNGAQGRVMIVETIGGGAGWLDLDNDGRWDLVANQAGDPTSRDWPAQPVDQLFQNLGDQFRAVTQQARLYDPSYSQGISVGDFDNDGFDDIYIANLTANTLWHNCGDGTFIQCAQSAGVADERWSVSSAWTDLDSDGDLDLYVCNYVVYDPLDPQPCKDPQGRDALCNPGTLQPWPDACFINQGDGRFTEEAVGRGLTGKNNRALGVAVADFSGDRLPDVYVANDTTENFLFINQGAGQFEEMAALLGCAVDREGASQASMGVAVGDFDGNGWQDLYVTNYYEESNTLYANYGSQGYQDVTAITQLHQPTLAMLGFGAVMEDFNQDGRMEIMVANGHVNNSPTNPVQEMPAQLFSYANRRWDNLSHRAGSYFAKPRFGRGVASGDFDADGAVDLAVLNQNAPLALLRNVSPRGHWLSIAFHGRQSNRRGVGCQVTLHANEVRQDKQLCAGTSYASSMQPILHFGLGAATAPVRLLIHWPSGIEQSIECQRLDQQLEVWEPLAGT